MEEQFLVFFPNVGEEESAALIVANLKFFFILKQLLLQSNFR